MEGEKAQEGREKENYSPPFLTTVSLMSGTGVLSSSVASAKSSPVMSSSSTATIRSPGHSLPSRQALPSSNISSMIRPPYNQHKINDITQNMIYLIFNMVYENCTHIRHGHWGIDNQQQPTQIYQTRIESIRSVGGGRLNIWAGVPPVTGKRKGSICYCCYTFKIHNNMVQLPSQYSVELGDILLLLFDDKLYC